MNAEQTLFDAYREWYRLAKAGNKAIGRRDWDFLLECQNITRSIQASIATLTQDVRNQWKQEKALSAAKDKKLREMISELMKVLESNQKLLRAVRVTASAEREKLLHAGRNLRRIQNSYAGASSSAWMSFS